MRALFEVFIFLVFFVAFVALVGGCLIFIPFAIYQEVQLSKAKAAYLNRSGHNIDFRNCPEDNRDVR